MISHFMDLFPKGRVQTTAGMGMWVRSILLALEVPARLQKGKKVWCYPFVSASIAAGESAKSSMFLGLFPYNQKHSCKYTGPRKVRFSSKITSISEALFQLNIL